MGMRGLSATVLAGVACFTDPPPAGEDEAGSSSASTSDADTTTATTATADATSSGNEGVDPTTGGGGSHATTTGIDTTGIDTTGTDTTDTGSVCVHRVFTTVDMFTGLEVDSFTNASLLCADEAEDAGLEGVWAAVLSDARGPAGAHLVICGDVVLANDGDEVPADTLVATEDKWWSIDHMRGIDRHADGTPVPDDNNAIAWTGTRANGTSADHDCEGWSTADFAALGTFGWTNDLSLGSWADEDGAPCSQSHRLYCIEQLRP